MFVVCNFNSKMNKTNFDMYSITVVTKFEIANSSFKIVLKDGCQIDDDDAFEHLNEVNTVLYLLKENEALALPTMERIGSQSTGNR